MKTGILEPEDFSEEAISQLHGLGMVFRHTGEKSPKDFIADKDILFVRLAYYLDEKLLSGAKNLSFICSPTTGLNHIDLNYCRNRGIRVLSLKGERRFLSTIRATSEHTFGLILALLRNYNTAFLNSLNPVWDRNPYRGFELYKNRVGIIGFGRIGKQLAAYLRPFGCSICLYDPNIKSTVKSYRRMGSISELIENSDVVALCSSYEPGRENLIGRKELHAMKDKYFINTARGELTDETELTELAGKGHFKGLAVDVIQSEQGSQKNLDGLLKAADRFNVLITPHIGGATYTSMERTELFMTSKLFKLMEKHG